MDTDSVESEDMALEESSNDESNELDAEIDQLGVSRKFRDRRRNSWPQVWDFFFCRCGSV